MDKFKKPYGFYAQEEFPVQPIPIFKEREGGTFNLSAKRRIAHLKNFVKEIFKALECRLSPPTKPQTLPRPTIWLEH